MKCTGRQRTHHHVVENFGDRLRSEHDAKFSRAGPRAVGESKRAAHGVAAQHAGVTTHRGRGIAERGGGALGVERFDYRRDGRVEVRALVDANFSEIRVEDRDSIANHRHITADDQARVFSARITGPLRECSERAVEHVPRGGRDRTVPNSRQVALFRWCRLASERDGRKAGEMRIDDGGAARTAERVANRVGREITGFGCGADFVRVTAHRDPQLEAVGMQRLEFLEAAARNVRSVCQAGNSMLRDSAVNLVAREVALARKNPRRFASERFEFRERSHQLPARRARERSVGPPLDIRLTCIGWPLPQLGIAIRRRSLPTASTLLKKLFESAITLPERNSCPIRTVIDLVNAACRDSKIFARLGNRRNLMAADIVTALDVGDDFFRRRFTGQKECIGHSDQRHVASFARTRRAVGLRSEHCSSRARIQEAAENAALDMHHAAPARAFVVVAIVAVAVETRIGASRQQRRRDLLCPADCRVSERRNQLRPA